MIEEAIKNFSKDELDIHNKLKDINEDLLFQYVLKRQFYKDPTKQEIDCINDIYEDGLTYFDVSINNKVNKFKLLSQFEKNDINLLVDKEFNSKSTKRSFVSEEFKNQAIMEFRVVATVAAAIISMSDSIIENEAESLIKAHGSVLAGKTYWLEALPMPLLRTLYDRYMDFENRIFDIFQYETVRKKSNPPQEIA